MTTTNNTIRGLIQGIAVAGALLILGGLAWLMIHCTQPPPLNAQRAAERARALAEMQVQNRVMQETYGWVDPARGIVRLPIAHAMKMAVQNYQSPAAGRSNLIARVEKATARLPAKVNHYE